MLPELLQDDTGIRALTVLLLNLLLFFKLLPCVTGCAGEEELGGEVEFAQWTVLGPSLGRLGVSIDETLATWLLLKPLSPFILGEEDVDDKGNAPCPLLTDSSEIESVTFSLGLLS